ncbi:hypothetical protein O3W44_05600 [Pantoea sp. LMR881]|uniref:hypothetical protein n=1 Tax=Pantoea sp. LMR881 TaxID=3014336 RepID=UPI0022AF6375|nr:hypothetical protein [Pantoea sp. LMR881]MCZ4058659.1 hypothetical protein [Pantoea sp. LMR881]
MTADKWSLFEDLSMINVYAVIPHLITLSNSANASTINMKKGDAHINKKKKEIWDVLMKKRPLKAKIKHRIRRGFIPLFTQITDHGKGI